jgi:amino acid permease
MWSSWVGYCFSLNYILGVGILGIPHAITRAGITSGVVILAAVSIASYLPVLWIIGAMRVHRSEQNEVVDLVQSIMGSKWKLAYKVSVGVYLFGALWSYAAVFGTSMAAHIPFLFNVNNGNSCDLYTDQSAGCRTLYSIYIAIFAVIVVPLACKDLKDQKIVQITLSIMRFLTVFFMAGSVILALSSGTRAKGSQIPKPTFDGLIAFLPIAIYSQVFHHSIPGLIRPLKNKESAPKIFAGVLLTTFLLYTLLGVSVGEYFGNLVDEACTINWANPDSPANKYISYFIVLFPAFDVISAFPINAITLANNMLSEEAAESIAPQSAGKLRFIVRVLSGLLPIAGAFAVSNLDAILKWCGFLGVMIAFVFPALLSLYSRNYSAKNSSDLILEEDSAEEALISKEKESKLSTFFDKFVNNSFVIYGTLSVSAIVIILIMIITANPHLLA